jgi:RND family efflux transporter MFP subunit
MNSGIHEARSGSRPASALWIGLLAACATLTAGCAPQNTPPQIEFRVPVFAREVGTGDVEDNIVATGTLRAPESVSLRTETAGTLLMGRRADGRALAEGDRIQAGTLIAEVTGEDVRLAARTDSTFSRYETARKDHDSKKRLFDAGLLSDLDFRQLQTTLADAKIEWERSLLTESRSRLVSPISGVILRLARDEQNLPLGDGQLVAQGYVVAQIAPTDALIADVDLIGLDLSRARAGLPARVRHHAWDDQDFDGRVLRLAPTLDPQTRTLRAEVLVKNPGRKLRPGMFVEVTMIAERREGVAVVPREAVTERGGTKVVFVLNGQRVARRDVVLGLGNDELVEVTSGVETGERVVVRGIETLTDGTRVRTSGT